MLIYAHKKECGSLVHVDEVPNGKDCDCICPNPDCKTPLIARNRGNKKKRSHFAHYAGKEGRACLMTQLHLIAQEFFLLSEVLELPAETLEIAGEEHRHGQTVVPNRFAQKEYKLPDSEYIADVCVESDDQKFLIEIAVTNPCKSEKRSYYASGDIPVIEYDLSKYMKKGAGIEAALRDLEGNSVSYEWLRNNELHGKRQELEKRVRDKEAESQLLVKNSLSISLVRFLQNRKKQLPKIVERRKYTSGDIIFSNELVVYQGGEIEFDSLEVLHSYDSHDTVRAKKYNSKNKAHYIYFVFLYSENIPEVVEQLPKNVLIYRIVGKGAMPKEVNVGQILPYLRSKQGKPVTGLWDWEWQWHKYTSISEKYLPKALAEYKGMQEKRVKLINRAKFLEEEIRQARAMHDSNSDSLHRRDYGRWLEWMRLKKLKMPKDRSRYTCIPRGDFSALWMFGKWNILALAHVVDVLTKYPIDTKVSITTLYNDLKENIGFSPEFKALLDKYKPISGTTIVCDWFERYDYEGAPLKKNGEPYRDKRKHTGLSNFELKHLNQVEIVSSIINSGLGTCHRENMTFRLYEDPLSMFHPREKARSRR